MGTNNKEDLDFSKLNELEKEEILKWAKEVRAIQKDKELTSKQKIKMLTSLNNGKALKSFSTLILNRSKSYWKTASWSERLGILGGGGTFVLVGASGSGIAG